MDDRFNTAAGWVLFSGIVALGASIASGMYFHADDPEAVCVVGEACAAVDTLDVEEGPDLGTLLAAADPAAGEAVFAKCTACHTIAQGAPDGIGPNLYGILGKPIGQHAAGFAYSSALVEKGGEWTWENMDAWLESPRSFAPGTKMSFAGLSSAEDRANVMVYLASMGGAPPKPEPAAPVAEEGDASDAPGAGPGAAEGADPSAVQAAGAMSADQPVPEGDPTGSAEPATGDE